MKTFAQRAVIAGLALSVLAGPLLAVSAEAGPKHRRGERRVERRHERRQDRHRHRQTRVVYRTERHRDHEHGVVPFLGGVAVGAILGSQRSCPAPPPRQRVYVYDCGFCDGTYRDYDGYIDHIVVVHHVSWCDVERYYPMYEGGYWEEY